jgi:hypothetical protein
VRRRGRLLGSSGASNASFSPRSPVILLLSASSPFLSFVLSSLFSPSPFLLQALTLSNTVFFFSAFFLPSPLRDRSLDLSFITEIRASGPSPAEFQGATDLLTQSKRLAEAWRALPEEEKKVHFFSSFLPLSFFLAEKRECH